MNIFECDVESFDAGMRDPYEDVDFNEIEDVVLCNLCGLPIEDCECEIDI